MCYNFSITIYGLLPFVSFTVCFYSTVSKVLQIASRKKSKKSFWDGKNVLEPDLCFRIRDLTLLMLAAFLRMHRVLCTLTDFPSLAL